MSATKHGLQILKKIRPTNAVNTNWEVGKFANQLDSIKSDSSNLEKKWEKLNYTATGYARLGLLNDDMLHEESSLIKMARKRMTDEQAQARWFRINRAMLLSANHQLLPKDQWTPMDAEHQYMKPIVDGMKKEIQERNLMKCALLDFESSTERLAMIPFRIINYLQIYKLRNQLKQQLLV